jgi:hypothetical protein
MNSFKIKNNYIKTENLIFSELCEEVDYWKRIAIKLQKECDRLSETINKLNKECICHNYSVITTLLIDTLEEKNKHEH